MPTLGVGVRRQGLLIAVLATVTAVLFAVAPQLDLRLSHLFFDDATHRFPVAADPLAMWVRGTSMWVFTGFAVCVAAAVVARLAFPRRFPIPGRVIAFLALTLALGPGLLVNGLLKEHWSRPRPGEVVEFGGTSPFMPWWDPRGACEQNCSFVSGETSQATWAVAPAVLLPGGLRVVALGTVGIFTAVIGGLRLAFGGHFASDVLFAALLTLAVIWAVYGLAFRVDWSPAQSRLSRAWRFRWFDVFDPFEIVSRSHSVTPVPSGTAGLNSNS
ncbi:MAG: phosphatase PAP2 family protein [Xanthobacteraceae bacterium]|nr:phosphatase PAP2 family protein [Xanthobacteraceae bacterium]